MRRGRRRGSLAHDRLVPQTPFVCILRCLGGTFCVGHTDNLAARIVAHNAGTGSTYTAVCSNSADLTSLRTFGFVLTLTAIKISAGNDDDDGDHDGDAEVRNP